jgi:hypothetical protein
VLASDREHTRSCTFSGNSAFYISGSIFETTFEMAGIPNAGLRLIAAKRHCRRLPLAAATYLSFVPGC